MLLSNFAHKAALEAFKELTPAQKKVWNLCRKQGLSMEKAADKLAISGDAVEKRLKCADKKFKSHLERIKEQYDA